MTLPFKPHLIALVCSAGLFAASGVLYVKSRAPEAPAQAAAPAPEPTQTAVPAPVDENDLYHCANRSMGRACRALSRCPAFAGAHGLHLPGERGSGRPVVAR